MSVANRALEYVMAYPVTLPAMAALSIAGAALGVQLGRSAIAEVNPLYFNAPHQARFFADLAPKGYRMDSGTSSESSDSWSNELNVSGRDPCLDCSRNFIEPETVEAALPDWDQSTLGDRRETEDPDSGRRASQIERYASFPVTAEEAAEQPRREAVAEDQGPALRQGGEEEPAPDGI
jgi:hypothetical protein